MVLLALDPSRRRLHLTPTIRCPGTHIQRRKSLHPHQTTQQIPERLRLLTMAVKDKNAFARQFCATLFSDSIVCTRGPSSPVGFAFGHSISCDPQDWDMNICQNLFCPSRDEGESFRATRVGVLTHLYMEYGELQEMIVRAPVCERCGAPLAQSENQVWHNGVGTGEWVKGLRDLATTENNEALA